MLHLQLASFVGDACSGVLAALAAAGLAWLYDFHRTRRTRRKLLQALRTEDVSTGVEGLRVPLENPTDVPVIVREVTVLLEGPGDERRPAVRCNYDGPGGGGHQRAGRGRDVPRHDFASDLLWAAQRERHFVVLPPRTSGTWLLPGQLIVPGTRLTHCSVQFEYRNLVGDAIVNAVEAPRSAVEALDRGLQHLLATGFKGRPAQPKPRPGEREGP